jgi:hypothetical protein
MLHRLNSQAILVCSRIDLSHKRNSHNAMLKTIVKQILNLWIQQLICKVLVRKQLFRQSLLKWYKIKWLHLRVQVSGLKKWVSKMNLKACLRNSIKATWRLFTTFSLSRSTSILCKSLLFKINFTCLSYPKPIRILLKMRNFKCFLKESKG